ncbi:MAG: transcription elongation factor GreA [Candidatus Berkelbacteria bacterium Licking1014_2]|uniref:Transcription elongation factor GreA n=1 Tax=Candidatus Berkelbacteria bacterium Licking1014_2 TaxID=2017146 RepID=A0A554LWC5_9BACT|nr:MAG: transcription elongation factor GreA [Candidatus Berkelbacteria bacterium Licking1014_2]
MSQITREGLEKIKEELRRLREEERPQVVERLENARNYGDLAENAEYEDARERQGFIESRIRQLEQIINSSQIVVAADSEAVDLTNVVDVEIDGRQETYQIVGSNEADPVNRKISAESPLGKVLMGKKVGDDFSYQTPGGQTVMGKIIKID